MVFCDVFKKSDDPALQEEAIDQTNKKYNSSGVNYDTNPTELYILIENQNWEAALERITNYPIESKVWVFRIDTETKKLRWKMLPLHAAIIFNGNDAVIDALIESFPDSVKMCDDRNMLPVRMKNLFVTIHTH